MAPPTIRTRRNGPFPALPDAKAGGFLPKAAFCVSGRILFPIRNP